MAAATYFAQVQQLYIAYFGRPADPIGQAYWAANIDAANGDISAVIAGFSASKESAELFGNKSTIDKVTAIYQNAFGRAPEPEGLAYWVAQLDSGKVSQAQASWTIQQNAGAGDAAVVQNKLTAAQAFTAKLDTTAAITGYQGADAAQMARDFLKEVTADNATATAAVEGAGAAIAAIVAVGDVGATFVLTSGTDVLNGTSGNDVFIAGDDAGNTSLNAGDTINGGAGTDTLKIFNTKNLENAAQFEHATISNVENVEVTFGAAAQKLNVSGNADVQNVTVVNGTGGEVSLGLKQQAGVTGTVGETTFAFQGANGTADSATLNLNNAKTAGLTIDSIETLNVVATGTNSVTNLNAGAVTTLVITGAGSLTTELVGTSTKTIDGSAATGDLVIKNFAAAAVQDIKTGAGNDTYTTTFASLSAGSQIDLGAGTNTLVFTDAVSINSVDAFDVTNVQVIKATGSGLLAVDGKSVSTTNFEVATTGKVTLTDLAQDSTVTLGAVVVNAASTAALKLGGNTLNLNLVGDTKKTDVAGFEVAGSSTVNVNSAGKAGVDANVLKLTTADNSTINVSGSQDLTLTTVNKSGVTGLTIDGSTFTGKLSVTGTASADIIKGGSNDDVLISGGGSDVMTGGAGKDVFNVKASAYGAKSDTISTITDFIVGTDKLVVADKTDTLTKVSVKAVDLAAALKAIAAGAKDDTTAAWGVFDGNTYVIADNDGSLDDTSVVVKLNGVLELGIEAAAVFA